MGQLNPKKLHVEFRDGVEETYPVLSRHYTLTHSDESADIYLTIGLEYAVDKIDFMKRDEVLGVWCRTFNDIQFFVYVTVDNPNSKNMEELRIRIFRQELPLALQGIRYGDRELFGTYLSLDSSPIYVTFISDNLEFCKKEYWGNFQDYIISMDINNSDYM